DPHPRAKTRGYAERSRGCGVAGSRFARTSPSSSLGDADYIWSEGFHRRHRQRQRAFARAMIIHRRSDDDLVHSGALYKGLQTRRDIVGGADRRALQDMIEDRARVRGQAVLIARERRLHLARIAGAQRNERLLLRRGEQFGLLARVGGEGVERGGGIGFG